MADRPRTNDPDRQQETTSAKAYKRRIGISAKESSDLANEVRECIETCYYFERDNRREAEIDLAFVAGDQWPQVVKQQRANTRPMLVINQIPQFVNQVVNPIREADLAIKVKPEDDQQDPKIARIYDQLISQIQYLSDAKSVYVTAHEHQVKCGIGWWRVASEYVDDASFDQELRIQKIRNPLSVYCDPGAVKLDRSDAMWIIVAEPWPRKTFKRKWPNAHSQDSVVIPSNSSPAGFLWESDDYVIVAEYYKKVPVMKTLALLESGETVDVTKLSNEQVRSMGIVSTRECHSHKVMKYVASGKEILEAPVEWPGKYIPLIPAIGGETPLKNGTMRFGITRAMRDPQQMMNFYRTATAEAIAWAPKTPWLVTDDMVSKYLSDWVNINTTNKPFLRYTPDKQFPNLKPERPGPPDVPNALIGGGEMAAEDMKRVSSIYDASLGARSNETSGVAIRSREAQGDVANNHYQDNLVHSLTHCGRVLVDLIPRIYDNQRIIRLTNPQGQEEPVTINRVLYEFDGKPILENDLSVGRFDVRVTVGKNFLTKRVEAVNALMEMTKGIPNQDAQLMLAYMMVKNSDWPGAEELAKYIKNMIPAALFADPNDPNAPKPPGPMDDPAKVAELEKLAAQIDETKQRTKKSWAETQKTLAETDLLDGQIDGQFAGTPLQQEGEEKPPKLPPDFEGGQLSVH